MNKNKIWLSSPHIGDKELEFVNQAFTSNWIAPLGPNVDGFEDDLSKYIGINNVAVLNSGTSAIHLALVLLGVSYGDEVICQSFTFSASANPIIYQGATPIFVDSEPNTWNMSPYYLRKAITERIKKGKKPKAIIIVHLYGMPASLNDLKDISNEFEIPIIEDAAEALGSRYESKACGSFGAFGILSFNGNKIITTSGGGALCSNNKELIDKARYLSTQARDPAPHYQHSQIGYNYRMSNICAGIGRGQMTVLNLRVNQRRANFEYYFSKLNSLNGFSFQEENFKSYSNRWLTAIVIDPLSSGGLNREIVRKSLETENIESRPLWKPMHLQPVFEHAPYYGDNIAENLFENGLCLPSGSNLTTLDLDRVINQIIFKYSS